MAPRAFLIALLVATACRSALANDTRPMAPIPAPNPDASEHFNGIVADQTITPGGQDFFKMFSTLWHDMAGSERFSIAIRERPSARLGNWIQIDYGNRTIFQALLPAARGNIRALCEQAVDIAYENISSAQAERLLFRDDDLAGDEF